MQEISVYLNNFEFHKQSYEKIHNSLKYIYKDYVNNEKIIAIFEYWLFSLGTLHKCYGNPGLEEFLKSKNNNPFFFSQFKEFKVELPPAINLFRKRNIIFKVNSLFPIQYRFPGAPMKGFFSRVKVRYTKLIVSQIPNDINQSLTSQTVQIIYQYLVNLNIKINKVIISKNIPKIFLSKQIECKNSKSIELYCAPMEIIMFANYENIFLLNRKIKVIGHPHGGGYDVALNDPLTYFEKNISNKFIGWGFSEENEHQTRYSIDKKIFNDEKKRKVIWIESPKNSKFETYCYPLQVLLHRKIDVPQYIFNELTEYNVKYFSKKYPGKLISNRYKKLRGGFVPQNQSAEKIINKNDVVLLEHCFQSLMYYCLENNIFFIIIDKREAVKYFTKKMLKWYKLLRKHNLLFHDDEYGLLGKKIKTLDLRSSLPKEVVLYYKNIFR